MNQEAKPYLAKLETPRAAAIAGLVFSVLLLISFVLVHYYVPETPLASGSWLANGWKAVSFALNLLPFAGIAFLWFIGVIRDHLGENEDRLFSTVFLGSGLLFLATLFVSAGIAGSVLRLYESGIDALFESGIYLFGRTAVFEILHVYVMRMAGVFMISTCTLALRTRILPRWMTYLGLILAVILLGGHYSIFWSPAVFPLWVLLVSLYMLVTDLRQ